MYRRHWTDTIGYPDGLVRMPARAVQLTVTADGLRARYGDEVHHLLPQARLPRVVCTGLERFLRDPSRPPMTRSPALHRLTNPPSSGSYRHVLNQWRQETQWGTARSLEHWIRQERERRGLY